MCLSCQEYWQTIVLIISPDNPNRICKSDSYCARGDQCIGAVMFSTVFMIIFYFFSLGLGYYMTYAIVGTESILCNNNQGSAFYCGCFLVGFICVPILGLCVYIIYFLYTLLIKNIIPFFSGLGLESAKNIQNKSELKINSDNIDFEIDSDEIVDLEE